MRDFEWNDVLRLPDAALAGDRRIPKTVLTRQAQLSKTEQKVLDRVGVLAHFATVQKSTTRIPPAVDDEHDIQSVLFLRCELSRGAAYAEVARLVHKCFPNPTVILFGGEGEACVSVATTRKSLAEQGATIIDAVQATGAFNPSDARYVPFLDALSFEWLPQADLLAYLHGLTWAVRLSRTVPSLGFFPMCAERDCERLDKLIAQRDALATRVASTRERRRCKDISLNDSAHLRMELKMLEKELGQTTDKIKEICNG